MERATCTICQEPLVHDNTAACQCGHTFHCHCILAWYERSKSCPQCRKTFRNTPIKLYFDVTDDTSEIDYGSLRIQLNDCNVKILEHTNALRKKGEEILNLESHLHTSVVDLEVTKSELRESKATCTALKRQLGLLDKMKDESSRYKNEARDLRSSLEKLTFIQTLVDGEKEAVGEMLKDYADHGNKVPELATSFVILKKEFERIKDHKDRVSCQNRDHRKHVEELKQKLAICQIDKKNTEQRCQDLESDLHSFDSECKHLREKLRQAELLLTSDSPKTSLLKRHFKESPAPEIRITPKLSSADNFSDENVASPMRIDRTFSGSKHTKRRKKTSDIDDVLEELGVEKVRIRENQQVSMKRPPKMSKLSTHFEPPSNDTKENSLITITNTYNGFGGRSRVLTIQNKKVSNVKIPKKRQPPKDSHGNPRLPSLDDFFNYR